MIRPSVFGFLFATLLTGCAAVHLMQAEHAYNLRQYDEAKTLAKQAVSEDPQSVPAKKLLGKILVQFGADALERDDLGTAKRYFEEASNLSPRDPLLDSYLDMIRHEERRREATARGFDQVPRTEEHEQHPKRERAPKIAQPSVEASPPAGASQAKGLTVVEESSLYDAPSPFAAKVGNVSTGARLNFIREAGGWYEVETKDGRRGYVKGEAVK
jgi:tetratricopeptide (TPR) repeat protein